MYKNQDRIKYIGKHTYGVPNIDIYYWGEGTHVEIGAFCSISGYILLYLGGNHRTDWVTTFPFGHISKETFTLFDGEGHPTTKGNVIIGNDVWIGTGVTIMSGITIGDGACIASNSVVTKNVEPYTIVGGNPAKVIKKRFTDDQIKRLLELKWWELPDEEINKITPLLCSDNIDKLLYALSIIRHAEFVPPTSNNTKRFKITLNKDLLNSLDLTLHHNELVGDIARQYFKEDAGKEHYRLLAYMSTQFNDSTFIDIGTYQAASAVALSFNERSKVLSFDLDKQSLWYRTANENINYIIGDVLNYIEDIKSSPLIFFDTEHDGTFETILYNELNVIKYTGILIADDIHLNPQMEAWWASIHHKKYDITQYGHWSGTGIVLFGNQELILE